MDKEIIIYKTPESNVSVEVSYGNDTFWLTQKAIAHLFGVEVPAISKHLKNIFNSSELIENSVVSKMEITANDGKKYLTSFYNLDAIIAVGYRVNSYNATQFRIWATNVLKDYLLKVLCNHLFRSFREISYKPSEGSEIQIYNYMEEYVLVGRTSSSDHSTQFDNL
jgi:hypothetical protein